jgi:hypothetical protein
MKTSGNQDKAPRSTRRRTAAALFASALCVVTAGGAGLAAPAEPQAASQSRAAIERIVAEYVGLYARPTLDRWRTLFHESLVVAHPTDNGGIRTRHLDEFFKAQKDYFETGRKVSERLENVRIDEGRRMALVGADFVFVDEGEESRGRLGLHLVETSDGWKITAIVFSYDKA